MEQISNISWVLVGVQPVGASSIEKEVLDRLMMESFIEGKKYQMYLCGSYVNIESDLQELEKAYLLLRSRMEDYQEGDYAIVSKHPEANLLFIPIESNDEDLSGNTNDISGESSASA
jgi:hypothetical protein